MGIMTKTVGITINGRLVQVRSEANILDAAREAGVYIPALCAYKGLKPLAEEVPDMACQLCVVEVNGSLALACDSNVGEGAQVQTESVRITELRRKALTEIMRRHPSGCLVCNRRERCRPTDVCLRNVAVDQRCVLCPANGSCELQSAVDHVGLNELPPYQPKKLSIREDSPVFLRDHNLCILCQRCVRVCDHIRGATAIEWAFPCHKACPAGIDIPRYIRMVGRGRPSASLAVIREKVPFPGVLGRVCIHPCEGACQRGLEVDKPLQIRMIKRFAADNGDDSWKQRSKRLPPTGKSVAVVGAGPAGLTAAYYLAKQGHKVTVFEALPKPGGAMLVGIPEYRLPRDVLEGEIKEITDIGVEIKVNTRIASADSLFQQGFSAVFIGLGAHQGQKLGVEGENLPGVLEAVEFLRRANLGEKIHVGKRVGVVGGGNVAIDAVRIALRLGAEQVSLFYRRTKAEMPAAAEEVEAAEREGVVMNLLSAPSKVTVEGETLRFECKRMKLGEADASGRARPVEIPGSEFVTELDTLIAAIGQRPDVPKDMMVETERGNIVKVGQDMQTTRKGVFSAGDCVTGPASVIGAIAGARKAASAIDKFLGGEGDICETLTPSEEATNWLTDDLKPEKYADTAMLPAEIAKTGFDEVEQGWNRETAMAEAQRCLRCYVIAPPNDKVLQDANCQFCGACVDACPTGALVERSLYASTGCERSVTTICPYCGVGCQLRVDVKGNSIVRVTPDPEGPANRGQACVKGKFGLDFVFHPDRLKVPLIRKDGKFAETDWETALNEVAMQLSKYKPDEIAVISSAKNTNEDNYVAQKFTRAVLGTNTIDHCARL